MLELDNEAVRVLKKVVHGHSIQCANWIILGLKDEKWNIDIGDKAITIIFIHTIILPRDISVETVDRIISENFRTNKVVKVNYRVMILQLIGPFFAKVLVFKFFTI